MAVTQRTSIGSTLLTDLIEMTLFVLTEQVLMPSLVTNFTGQGMNVRRVPIYPQVTAQVVADGVDFANATELTKTDTAQFTPAEIMAQAVITDARLATDPENALADAAQELGTSLGTKIDVDLVGLFANLSVSKGSAGNSLTIANVAAGISVLRNNNVPAPLSAVYHPYHWHDLWVLLGQPAANQDLLGDVANDALRNFNVSNWLGVAHFIDSNIAVDGSDDADSAVFGRQAMGLDTRMSPRFEQERDASLRATEINAVVWYATGEIRDSHGVRLIADATEPT